MKWSVPKIWKGSCWIIGGGSSISEQFNIPETLIPETIEQFQEYGNYLEPIHSERIIGVNIAAFLGNWVDVAYWGDSDTYTDYKKEFDEYPGLKVSSAGKFSQERFRNIKHLYKDATIGMSEDNTALSWIGRNTGSSAINLAYLLGADKIYLLGFDMYAEGRMHFHAGYPDKRRTPRTKLINQGGKIPRVQFNERKAEERFKRFMAGFDTIAMDCEKLSVEVINVNPKSKIESFPKKSLSEILNA